MVWRSGSTIQVLLQKISREISNAEKSTKVVNPYFSKSGMYALGKHPKLLHILKVFICPSAIAKNNYICPEIYVVEPCTCNWNFVLISAFAVS